MRTIHRRSPARNEARFVTVALQADLLAGWTVVWVWWRICSAGRVPRAVSGLLRLAAADRAVLALAMNTTLIAASGGGGRGASKQQAPAA